jgi:thymidylate synthase ThyX
MRVTLLDYTGAPNPWRAADLLIFTKNTRLKMAPDGLIDIMGWPIDKKMEELTYAANTIRSSWEMVDYMFLMEDVTRAFTHQLVRTRHGSYAQQTMQILKVDATSVEPPRSPVPDQWHKAVGYIAQSYEIMLANGATVEQARGILPTNIRTNIVCKFNLRTLVEIFDQRISPRNLGEYREVAEAMRAAVLEAHPWAKVFLEQSRDQHLRQLDEVLKTLRDNALGPATRTTITNAMKLVDQIRRSRPVEEE